MRKHLSIMMLAARLTVLRVFGLLAAMSSIQTGLFLWAMKRNPEQKLVPLLTDSGLQWVLLLGFVILCRILCSCADGSGGSKSVYTMRRLAVSELTTTGWWALHYSLMFLVFWLWEALTMLGLCMIYVNRMPEAAGPQTVFIACYQAGVMHQLIPLDDISGWIRNGVMVLGLGICSSAFAYHGRHGARGMAIWFMAIVTVTGFAGVSGAGNTLKTDMIATFWGLMIAGTAVGVIINRERHPEEHGE